MSLVHIMLKVIKRKWVLVGVGIGILVIGIVWYMLNRNQASGYVLEKVQQTPLSEVVSESGEIIASGNVPIYSPTNGFIEKLYVTNGEEVGEGQELFTVVSSASQEEKQKAYTAYLTAKTVLDTDTANLYTLQSNMYAAWKIYTDLSTNSTYEHADKTPNVENRKLPEFVTVNNDWLAAEAHFKNQEGVVAKDQAALSSAYLSYLATQTTTVTAPAKAIVTNISVKQNSSVTVDNPLTATAKPVLLLTHEDAPLAKVSVGQTNIAKVADGQEVTIYPDAYKDKTYKGLISRVDSIGQNKQGVITYDVYITINTTDKLLKAGMTLDADITTKKITNTLTVPNSAVVLYQGGKAIRVLENNKMVYVPVIIGITGLERTQILKGVTNGQEIIVALTNEKAARQSFLGL